MMRQPKWKAVRSPLSKSDAVSSSRMSFEATSMILGGEDSPSSTMKAHTRHVGSEQQVTTPDCRAQQEVSKPSEAEVPSQTIKASLVNLKNKTRRASAAV
jgi:hypothetical protein